MMNLFNLPELVNLVYEYLELPDRMRLGCVNKRLFYIIMPHLWEHVEEIYQILTLLPAEEYTPKDKLKYQHESTKPLVEGPMRLGLYGPWIKHVDLGCSGPDPNLEALYHFAASRILLPNLVSITIHDRYLENIACAIPILSPALLSFKMVITGFTYIPTLPMLESSYLIQFLSQKCPRLQTLSIFASSDLRSYFDIFRHTADKSRANFEAQIGIGTRIPLTSLCPLVSLASSAELIDPDCLSVISAWPALEALSISMNPIDIEYTIPVLPDTAFPSLKSFSVDYILDFDTFQMFWDVPTLVSRLKTIKICTYSDFFRWTNEEFKDTISQLFSVLVEKSPRLEDLWLHVVHPDLRFPRQEVPTSALYSLQSLPIHALHVEGIRLQDRPFATRADDPQHYDVDLAEYFSKAFPSLRSIGFPSHPLSWADLRKFKTWIPLLEYLNFDFDINSPLSLGQVGLEHVPRYRNCAFRTLEANFLGLYDKIPVHSITKFECCDAILFARYLFSIWPNVQIVTKYDEYHYIDPTVHCHMIELINKHLAALAYCNRDASIHYEDIRVLNEESWTECLR